MKAICSMLVCFVLVASFSVQADQLNSRLDALFDELGMTLNPIAAAGLERDIWRIWGVAEEKTVRDDFARGVSNLSGGALERALADFDTVTRDAPEFAEGWNKRATVLFLLGNYDASVIDIQRTLALEPRHFGALSGLALIYERTGLDEAALDVLIRVKEIYPGMRGIDQRMERLRDALARKRT